VKSAIFKKYLTQEQKANKKTRVAGSPILNFEVKGPFFIEVGGQRAVCFVKIRGYGTVLHRIWGQKAVLK